MDIHSDLPYSNRDVMDSDGNIRHIEDFSGDNREEFEREEYKRQLEIQAIKKYEQSLALKEGPQMRHSGGRYKQWVSLVCGARRDYLESRDIWTTKEPGPRASDEALEEFHQGVALWSLYKEAILKTKTMREQRLEDLENNVAEPLSVTVK